MQINCSRFFHHLILDKNMWGPQRTPRIVKDGRNGLCGPNSIAVTVPKWGSNKEWATLFDPALLGPLLHVATHPSQLPRKHQIMYISDFLVFSISDEILYFNLMFDWVSVGPSESDEDDITFISISIS